MLKNIIFKSIKIYLSVIFLFFMSFITGIHVMATEEDPIISPPTFIETPVVDDKKESDKPQEEIEDEPIILGEEDGYIDDDQDIDDTEDDEDSLPPISKKKSDGWIKVKNKGKSKVYKFKIDGDTFARGRTKINKRYYYFDSNNILIQNRWVYVDKKKTYYADKDGVLAKGFKNIGNHRFYFDKKSNKLVQDLIKEFGEGWYKKQNIYVKVNKYYNCVTIYSKEKNKKDLPIKAFPCTVGYATRLLNTTLRKNNTYRWHQLMGPTYGQFCTRIDRGMLFHSVIYRSPNKYSLIARQYNKLGITASHGCVRLAVVDAKRIYDDVRRLGKVGLTIYSDAKSASPLDKPSYPKVKLNQRFDPTDPTIK